MIARTTRTALLAGGVVFGMISLSFASVPFYRWFCERTGFGGTVVRGSGEGIEVSDATVIVRFDATLGPDLPWSFAPETRSMNVQLGETALAWYVATNLSDQTVTGRATDSIVPDAAGGFLTKIQCFCFDEQVLQPHETVRMPVSFYVDPAMLDDPDGRGVHEITLGYVFYRAGDPALQASAEDHDDAAPAAALPPSAPRAID